MKIDINILHICIEDLRYYVSLQRVRQADYLSGYI